MSILKSEKNAGLVEESLNAIGKLLDVPVEGAGWTLQDGVVTLAGVRGEYFASPDTRNILQRRLPDTIQANAGLQVFSAAEVGLNGSRTLALLPCDPTVACATASPAIGLLLALPPGRTLTQDQWSAACSIARLMITALSGASALEESHRRQVRLRAVATIGRDATVLLNPDELLNEVAQLISQEFGFYHVGIFLIDDVGEYAVLRASNSEYGKQLLAQDHRLKVGEQGMVGDVTVSGRAHIASDVRADTTHYENPLLPDTHAEITLPMYSDGQMIGALDVQSTEEDAFTEDDVTTLQIMADQLAHTLVNARLHEEVQQRLDETRLLREIMVQASALNYQDVLQKALELLLEALPFPYQAFFTRKRDELVAIPGSKWPQQMLSIPDTPWEKIWRGAALWHTVRTERPWVGKNIHTLAAIPIRNGDKTLAVFALATPERKQIRSRYQHFLEALSTQLSILLQNAQHYEASVRSEELLRRLILAEEQMVAAQEVPAILDILCTTLLSEIHGTVEVMLFTEESTMAWVKQAASPEFDLTAFVAHFIDPDKTLLGNRVLAKGNLIRPDQYATLKAEYPHTAALFEHLASRYLLIQPLQTADRRLGFLVLTLEPPKDNFLAERIAWIKAMANQAALTLDNAQLLNQFKTQAKELRRAYENARHLNEVRAQMIQNVSHELRTPLGIILGFAGLLEEETIGPLNSPQQEIVRTMHSRAQHLNRMIRNLTSIQGRVRLKNITPIALQDLLKQAVQEFQELAQQEHIQFYIEAQPEMPPIQGDAEQLLLALTHLVENAIKFSPKGGTILIRTRAEEDWAVITITDQGIGIPEEHLNHIFECFYQVDGSTTRRFGGMGIGLAVVWDIVEAHGGHVQVTSRSGKGSTFTVMLPRTRHPVDDGENW